MRPAKRQPTPALPDCPKCGCNATELLRAGQRWGRAWVVVVCTHCDHQFSLGNRPQPASAPKGYVFRVPYPKLHCPNCDGTAIDSRSSPKPEDGAPRKYRYHHCRTCGCDFSSWEDLQK